MINEYDVVPISLSTFIGGSLDTYKSFRWHCEIMWPFSYEFYDYDSWITEQLTVICSTLKTWILCAMKSTNFKYG